VISSHHVSSLIFELELKAEEMESAAKTAAQSGMYESGAALRNKAFGIRIAVEAIKKEAGL
jgi:hypothetical protein